MYVDCRNIRTQHDFVPLDDEEAAAARPTCGGVLFLRERFLAVHRVYGTARDRSRISGPDPLGPSLSL